MKSSTFNFLVAIFCGLFAVFGNQIDWIVSLNVFLAVLNLLIGITLHTKGQ